MAELVRALEIVRSRLSAPASRPSLPLVLAASFASFALGVGATVALLRTPAPVEPVVVSAIVEPSAVPPSRIVEQVVSAVVEPPGR